MTDRGDKKIRNTIKEGVQKIINKTAKPTRNQRQIKDKKNKSNDKQTIKN